MTSIKCFSCGFVTWADQETCKKCGASLAAPPPASPSEQAPDPKKLTPNGFLHRWWKARWAANAATLGALNLATLGLLGVGAILGVIVAVIALKKTKASPDRHTGRGFAVAGLVMTIVSIVIGVPAVVLFAIMLPNIRASRRAINEDMAIFCLRRIRTAETSFQSKKKKYGTLEELFAERLIDPALAKGERDGYKFRVIVSSYSPSGVPEFDALASPADYPSSGRRSFLIDETGVIHAADSKDGVSRSDPPLPELRAGQ